MKKILILILGILFTHGFSQKNTKVYYERKGDTVTYYADNREIYPLSFVFSETPELENVKTPEVFKTIQIIPARSLKNRITYFICHRYIKKMGCQKNAGL